MHPNILISRLFLALAGSLCAALASAQDLQSVAKGIYLGSPDECAQAKEHGLQSVMESGGLMLTSAGLEAVEYNCAFLQVTRNPRIPDGWVAVSMCEEPDYAYPEVFSIVQRIDGELDIAALSELRDAEPAETGDATSEEAESGDDDAAGVSGTYYRCDGVAAQ